MTKYSNSNRLQGLMDEVSKQLNTFEYQNRQKK